MTAKEVYKIWAPTGKKWVEWVRPVPLMVIGQPQKSYGLINQAKPSIQFLEQAENDELNAVLGINGWEKECLEQTAIIVDMSGDQSVSYGVALTKYGFRPIPVYNGTLEQPGSRATVDNQSVGRTLELMAKELQKIDIANNARPAFLLDRNRLNRYKLEDSVYDNSWDVYPQDLPSPDYLLENGIESILVIGGEKISRDVKKILATHQKKGLKIFHTDGYEKPRMQLVCKMPSWD